MNLPLRNSNIILSFIASSLIILLIALFQVTKGFSLWDEGFFWYGVQRVIAGDVPMRDFQSYDPGRYYWSAALMSAFGNSSLVALRISALTFQAIGLFAGTYAISELTKKPQFLPLFFSSLALALWMFPYYKAFDISLSIILIVTIKYFVDNPAKTRAFLCGICIGIVAIFGRNHGLYGALACIGAIILTSINSRESRFLAKRLSAWIPGVIIGYSPLLIMLVSVPNFADSFQESIKFQLTQSHTNLPLPIPWPWDVDFHSLSFSKALREVLLGSFFVSLLLFGVVSLLYIIRKQIRGEQASSLLIATSLLSLPYAHYAFSRADIHHLAFSIFPFLIGMFALTAASSHRAKWIFIILVLTISYYTTRNQHPGLHLRSTKTWIDVEIANNRILVDQKTAVEVDMLKDLAVKYDIGDTGIYVMPFWPGSYAVLGKQAPTWEIYALFHRPDEFERREIAMLQKNKPEIILIANRILDGKNELFFQKTHPQTFAYIINNYKIETMNTDYEVYKLIR